MTPALGLALLAWTAALLLRARLAPTPGGMPVARTALVALALAPLVPVLAAPGLVSRPVWLLLPALVVALLARDSRDRAATEAALKALWLLAPALALSWAGELLLALAAGTTVSAEQGAALGLALDPYALWSVALVLSLLYGWLLLGGVPLHFGLADLAQGAPLHVAPLAMAALQLTGAWWLGDHLARLRDFGPGLARVEAMLAPAAVVALLGGAAAVALQRRPERRVGLLAGLQGALVLVAFAGDPHGAAFADPAGERLGPWGLHLALALTAAIPAARLSPSDAGALEPPAVLFRRHPLAGAAALYGTASLAGVPGTPGALVWAEVARALAEGRHPGLLLALAAAWLAAQAAAVSEVRRAFGVPDPRPAPEAEVPRPLRLAVAAAAAGLLALLAWRMRS